MGRRDGRAGFCENCFKNFIKIFYEKELTVAPRLTVGRRGERGTVLAPLFLHGTVLGKI